MRSPTVTAKLDVFKIGSFVEWISELKFGNKGTLQSFSHTVGVAIKHNTLTAETIALLAGTKDQNWVTSPKGTIIKERTIGQYTTVEGGAPKVIRTDSEKKEINRRLQ